MRYEEFEDAVHAPKVQLSPISEVAGVDDRRLNSLSVCEWRWVTTPAITTSLPFNVVASWTISEGVLEVLRRTVAANVDYVEVLAQHPQQMVSEGETMFLIASGTCTIVPSIDHQ